MIQKFGNDIELETHIAVRKCIILLSLGTSACHGLYSECCSFLSSQQNFVWQQNFFLLLNLILELAVGNGQWKSI